MTYNTKMSGNRIRQLRIKSGLTQEKVANALGIDQSFYGRIETGKKGCSVDLFIQLSILFDVSLDYLILGKFLSNFSKESDMAQSKTEIKDLIGQLERFEQSI